MQTRNKSAKSQPITQQQRGGDETVWCLQKGIRYRTVHCRARGKESVPRPYSSSINQSICRCPVARCPLLHPRSLSVVSLGSSQTVGTLQHARSPASRVVIGAASSSSKMSASWLQTRWLGCRQSLRTRTAESRHCSKALPWRWRRPVHVETTRQRTAACRAAVHRPRLVFLWPKTAAAMGRRRRRALGISLRRTSCDCRKALLRCRFRPRPALIPQRTLCLRGHHQRRRRWRQTPCRITMRIVHLSEMRSAIWRITIRVVHLSRLQGS